VCTLYLVGKKHGGTQTGHYKLHFVNIRRKKTSAGHGMPTDFTPEEHSQGKEPAYEMKVGASRLLSNKVK
jgi:hypothetical protein